MTDRYPCLLFDADDTLLDFRRAEADALRDAFADHGIPFQDDWLPTYQAVNARAWRALEDGRLTAVELRVKRFEDLSDAIGVPLDAPVFAVQYLASLRTQAHHVDGALDLVRALGATHRMAIVTNGLSDVQRPRLARSPLGQLIPTVVISEEVGVAKPDPAIFALALAQLGWPSAEGVLVVGDSLTSDIAGGNAAGMATCWFNPRGTEHNGTVPTHEIRRLAELPAILRG